MRFQQFIQENDAKRARAEAKATVRGASRAPHSSLVTKNIPGAVPHALVTKAARCVCSHDVKPMLMMPSSRSLATPPPLCSQSEAQTCAKLTSDAKQLQTQLASLQEEKAALELRLGMFSPVPFPAPAPSPSLPSLWLGLVSPAPRWLTLESTSLLLSPPCRHRVPGSIHPIPRWCREPPRQRLQ